ncbi:M24 family metallopeptidase [Sporomusa aerivorans]|uniref:M24 family metallopeptidase n=1 Tax=Sporomusa aerivorans TaxID=204936 RepID=UPI00352A6992
MNYLLRRERILAAAGQTVHGVFIQDPDTIFYLTGYEAVINSRSVGLFMSSRKTVLIVPALAGAGAKAGSNVSDFALYYEQPEYHPACLSLYACLIRILKEEPFRGVLGVDYQKLPVADLQTLKQYGVQTEDVSGILGAARSIKEIDEQTAISTAAHFADFCISATLDAIKPGMTELFVEQQGIMSLTREVESRLSGAGLKCFTMTQSGAARTAMPHVHTGGRILQPGDGVVLCRQVAVNGYRAQCDRTIFLERLANEQRKYYSLVLAAQEAALETVRPGIPACKIEERVRDLFAQAGVAKYFIHRVGHGFGISMAEAPYLRFDSQERIEENMILVIQPALYIPEIGGFRCSDTILVQNSGNTILTKYPRDIASLTL